MGFDGALRDEQRTGCPCWTIRPTFTPRFCAAQHQIGEWAVYKARKRAELRLAAYLRDSAAEPIRRTR